MSASLNHGTKGPSQMITSIVLIALAGLEFGLFVITTVRA